MEGDRDPADNEKAVMAFFDIHGAGLAIHASGFDQEELVATMIGHVRDPDPAVSQKGISQFFGYLKQLAQINGRIATARTERTTRDQHGASHRQVVQGSQVLPPSPPSQPARPRSSTLSSREFLPPSAGRAAPVVDADG